MYLILQFDDRPLRSELYVSTRGGAQLKFRTAKWFPQVGHKLALNGTERRL
jgi:hypothetical protein